MEQFSVQLRVPPGERGVALGSLSSAEVVIVDDDSKCVFGYRRTYAHPDLISQTLPKPYQSLASFTVRTFENKCIRFKIRLVTSCMHV